MPTRAARVDAATGVPLARRVNDRLRQRWSAIPTRFAAFAALPTPDPKAAADELERTVTKLGFKGAMIHGLTQACFTTIERFWPIYERAAALDVPIYIHPALPQQAVIEAYYKGYVEKHPGLLRAGWGFNVETATQGIRLVLSGVFDAYPGLKIILGHMGEGLPFYLWRISHGLARSMGEKTFREIFCRSISGSRQRLLLRSGAHLLHDGDGDRPHPVLGRLPVRRQPAGRRVDQDLTVERRGPREIAERQRPPLAEALGRVLIVDQSSLSPADNGQQRPCYRAIWRTTEGNAYDKRVQGIQANRFTRE